MRSFPRPRDLVLSMALVLSLAGCQGGNGGNIAHQRSLAELNQKAQQLMQAGDYPGAIARLESARDLEPENVPTLRNLAIAYQAAGQYDKAIDAFNQLLGKPGVDQAEVHRSLGITHEAVGDQRLTLARELRDDPTKAKSAERSPEQLKEDAIQHYQLAVQHYEQSLAGTPKPDEVQAQISALRGRLAKPDELLPP